MICRGLLPLFSAGSVCSRQIAMCAGFAAPLSLPAWNSANSADYSRHLNCRQAGRCMSRRGGSARLYKDFLPARPIFPSLLRRAK